MRKIEISAYSLEEAKIEAFKQGITVIQDATISWRRNGSPLLSRDISIFAADYLQNKGLFDFEGAGMIITIKNGRPDKQKKPSILNNIVRKGRCKLNRTIEIRSKDEDKILGIAHTKSEAIKLARQLVKKYLVSVYGKTVYISNDIDFELEYKPSKNRLLGQYIVFGVDSSDVELSKKHKRKLQIQ